MEIYKNKLFTQWCKKEKLTDDSLFCAMTEMKDGIYDANLGGYIFKKRIAIQGQGKRESLRTIIAYKNNDKAIFIYGYAKNNKANVSPKELMALKKLAKLYFSYSKNEILTAIKAGELIEVKP